MRRPHVNHINVTLITLELSADVEKTDKKEHYIQKSHFRSQYSRKVLNH